MAVGSIESSYSQGTGLMDVLRSLREEAGNFPDAGDSGGVNSPSAAAVAELTASPKNVMAGNFVSAQSSESRYIAAAKQSFTLARQQSVQEMSRVESLLHTLGGIQGPQANEGTGSKSPVQKATIDLALKRLRDTEAQEASRRNLAEIKRDIEQKAAEATAPKDANGEPIESPVSGSAGSAPAPGTSAPSPGGGETAEAPASPTVMADTAIAAYTAASSAPAAQEISVVV